MSQPREEMPVAMRMGARPVRKARLHKHVSELTKELEEADIHGILPLALVTLRMDRCGWQTAVVEEVVEQIDLRLRVAEDDRASWLHREQQVVDSITLLVLVD